MSILGGLSISSITDLFNLLNPSRCKGRRKIAFTGHWLGTSLLSLALFRNRLVILPRG